MAPWGELNLGGVNLNYSWVTATSYANLPSGKPANTLGFITSTAVPNVYFQNGTVSGMSTGDVVIRQSVTSSSSFNMLQVGKLYINPSGSYQYNGSAWVAIDSYVYNGSSWVLISAIYYDNGTIPANINDYLAYKISGTTCAITKSAGEMYVTNTSAVGWGYGQYPIDVTNISTLWFTCKRSSVNGVVGIVPNYTTDSGRVSSAVSSTSYGNVSVDVSAVTGNYYLIFGYAISNTSSVYVQKIWGV